MDVKTATKVSVITVFFSRFSLIMSFILIPSVLSDLSAGFALAILLFLSAGMAQENWHLSPAGGH